MVPRLPGATPPTHYGCLPYPQELNVTFATQAAESEVSFQVTMVRQRLSGHPEESDTLGALAGCWLINDIVPDYSEWAVKDPIHAGRCPDFFTRPKRSAES